MKTFTTSMFGLAFVFLQHQVALAQDVKASWLMNAGEAVCDSVGSSLPKGCVCKAKENDSFQIDCAEYKILGQTKANLVADFSVCTEPATITVKKADDQNVVFLLVALCVCVCECVSV